MKVHITQLMFTTIELGPALMKVDTEIQLLSTFRVLQVDILRISCTNRSERQMNRTVATELLITILHAVIVVDHLPLLITALPVMTVMMVVVGLPQLLIVILHVLVGAMATVDHLP